MVIQLTQLQQHVIARINIYCIPNIEMEFIQRLIFFIKTETGKVIILGKWFGIGMLIRQVWLIGKYDLRMKLFSRRPKENMTFIIILISRLSMDVLCYASQKEVWLD